MEITVLEDVHLTMAFGQAIIHCAAVLIPLSKGGEDLRTPQINFHAVSLAQAVWGIWIVRFLWYVLQGGVVLW
jgi:hypothetical protein